MDTIKNNLNSFLVGVFNDILKIEEYALSQGEFKNLSVKEFHVIEAIVRLGEENTAKKIARQLNITQGSLTTAVTTLVKKGMLIRKSGEKDKRVVKIFTTPLALKAQDHHLEFHKQLVNSVMKTLTNNELEIFVKGISEIGSFFKEKQAK